MEEIEGPQKEVASYQVEGEKKRIPGFLKLMSAAFMSKPASPGSRPPLGIVKADDLMLVKRASLSLRSN